MIGFLRGRLLSKSADELVLLVGGVGYQLECPASTTWALPKAGEDASLFVSMVVREDAIRLFGFVSQIDKKIFETLISVSSVGPKLALALLGPMEGPELVTALHSRDETRLLAVPGVGSRKLEKLLVEMGPKLERLWMACQTGTSDFAGLGAHGGSGAAGLSEVTREGAQQDSSGAWPGGGSEDSAAGASRGKPVKERATTGSQDAGRGALEALVDERRKRREVLADLESALSNIGHREKFIRPCLEWVEKQWNAGTIAVELEDSLRNILQRQSARLVTSDTSLEPGEPASKTPRADKLDDSHSETQKTRRGRDAAGQEPRLFHDGSDA